MTSSLRSIASFRWSRCQWQTTYAAQLDGLQRRLVGCVHPVSPLPGGSAEAYFTRRHPTCSRVVDRRGKWSQRWAHSIIKWDAHIVRAHDQKNWGLPLRNFHGEQWLNRQQFGNSSRQQWGRTRTRSFAGRPATRCHEGLRAAKALLHRLVSCESVLHISHIYMYRVNLFLHAESRSAS